MGSSWIVSRLFFSAQRRSGPGLVPANLPRFRLPRGESPGRGLSAGYLDDNTQ